MYGANIDPQMAVRDKEAIIRPLSNKDNAFLRELLEDELKMSEHIQGVELETRKKMLGQKEMIMTENKSLAEFNLTYEPQLRQGRDNLKQLMQQIEQVRNAVLEKESRLRSNISAETALALLQTAAAESEESSEKLAESFYQKELDVEDFLDRFQDTRKRMHLHRVKAEKMVELVSQPNVRPLSGQRRAPPLPPYPIGPNPFVNNNI